MSIELKAVVQDGKEIIKAKCPYCGTWGEVDKAQVNGEHSCVCPNCEGDFCIKGVDYQVKISD